MKNPDKPSASLLAILCFLVFSVLSLKAQINIGGKPFSFGNNLAENTSAPVLEMPPVNRTEIDKEDQKDDQAGLPPRFGYPFQVELNLNNSGTWTTLDNGDRIWRLSISSPGALSINLTYDAFWLPPGASYYIYDQSRSKVIGGFTSQNNNSPKGQSIGFATGFVFSDQITLEYYEPRAVTGEGEIGIDQVVHGYRKLVSPHSPDDFGTSGNCNVNINCSPEGDIWQDIKHSVAMIIVNGIRWCTGSLLNTTVGDFKPYFLTADHCLTGTLDAATDPMAGNWMFVWEYESTGCDNGMTEPSTANSTTGAILVANNSGSDFALFRLIENPAHLIPSVPLWYNGWDATGSISTQGTGIHHPDGDIKKICIENNSLVSTNYFSETSNASGDHWMVFDWDTGVTEGGSSGSPLYDVNQRVVGQLHGGLAACSMDVDNDEPDWYGKFSVSWDGANYRRRLHDWLDPACPANLAINTNFTQGVEAFYVSNEITSTSNISPNTLVDYTAGNQIRLLPHFRAEQGSFFHARIRSCGPGPAEPESMSSIIGVGTCVVPGQGNNSSLGSSENRSNRPHQGDGFQCYPNPSTGEFFVAFEITASSAIVSISISDAYSRQVQAFPQRVFEAGQHILPMKLGQMPAGIYNLTLSTPDGQWVQKVVKAD
ncbi:MAG: trypsin-like serine peptidase [Saprospiraceae bacterium]